MESERQMGNSLHYLSALLTSYCKTSVCASPFKLLWRTKWKFILLIIILGAHNAPTWCFYLSRVCRCAGARVPVAFAEWYQQQQSRDVAPADLHIVHPEWHPAADRVHSARSGVGQHQCYASQLQPIQRQPQSAGASRKQPWWARHTSIVP